MSGKEHYYSYLCCSTHPDLVNLFVEGAVYAPALYSRAETLKA